MTSYQPRTERAAEFADAVAARPGDVLLAMDFDGTLSPIVPNPEDSRMLPAAAEALAALGPVVGTVAILTGRGVATVRELGRLDRRPGLERVVVLGQYGAERWDAATGEETPPEVPAAIAAARPEIEALLTDQVFDGVRLEDKGRALGVHARPAAQPGAAYAALAGPLRQIAERHGLVLEPGRSVLELRASSLTKGDALRALVAERGATVVAMCGDDLGDLPAFDALDALRADGIVTCAVVSASAEQPALADRADVLCTGPEGVAAWLTALAHTLGARPLS
ncbi:MAG: trehalose-phosphatase [Arachnia sp.]